MKYINEEMIKSRMDMAGFSEEYINHLIGNLSPTDVIEVKHGKWEERFEYQHEKFCSNCGIPQLWMNAVVYNYCPNCGADMREKR